MEAKRTIVLELLSRQKSPTSIARDLGISRQAVYNIKKRFDNRGTVKRKPGSGRKRSVRTKAMVKAVKGRILRNPVRTIRGIARDMNVHETAVRRAVKFDLGAKSRARRKKHLINNNTKAKRLERSKALLNVMKHAPPVIIFSDEKLFRVDRVSNSRTDRYISSQKPCDVPDNVKFTFKTKHAASLMVLGLVASNGKKCPPIIIQNNEKINAEVYNGLLKTHVVPWLQKEFKNTPYVFQQDGAPCHTAKRTQEWLEANFQSFWPKNLWPPSSPDLNPLDFNI